MKKTFKTSEAFDVYQIIGSAKYGKMSSDEKIKAWKVAAKLKPIATKLGDDTNDAMEKLKPTDNFDEMWQKAREYERLVKAKEPTIDIMSKADYDAFIKDFVEYQKTVNNAVKEFGEKEVEVEFEPLSEDAFGKLIDSNDWTLGQVALVAEFVCE